MNKPKTKPQPRPSYVRAEPVLTPEEQQAVAWLHTTRFLTTAAQLNQLPPHEAPEIAFVGRSNAGKSTSINTLTQQRQLAYASKTPGRTQHINLFSVGRQGATDVMLADLPGYGYAAVPKADKERWQRVMANYLLTRGNLVGVVMLIDPRHGLTELDEILLDVIRPRVEEGLKFLVLLTKSDKLTRMEAKKALDIARLQAGGGTVQLFSSLKKQGVAQAAAVLHQWVVADQKKQAKLAAKAERQALEGDEALDEADLDDGESDAFDDEDMPDTHGAPAAGDSTAN